MSPAIDDAGLEQDFLADAAGQVVAIRAHLAAIGGDQQNRAIASCYIAFRSVKAGAGLFERMRLSSLAAIGEELFFGLREGVLVWSESLAAIAVQILDATDALLRGGDPVDEAAVRSLGEQVAELLRVGRSSEPVGLTAVLEQLSESVQLFGPQGTGRRSKLFGDYLVERGLLSQEQLLGALVQQAQAERNHLELLVELGGLDPATCLQLANHAMATGADVLLLAHGRQLLDEPIRRTIENAIRRSRPPLGQTLVGMGIGNRRQVKNWLLDYYDECRPDADTVRASRSVVAQTTGRVRSNIAAARGTDLPTRPVRFAEAAVPSAPVPLSAVSGLDQDPDPVPVPDPAPHPESSAATPLSIPLPEAAPLIVEDELVTDFLAIYHADAQAELENQLVELRDRQGDQLVEQLNQIYRQLHSIKGSAGFIGAVVLQKILHLMEESVSLLQQHGAHLAVGDVDDVTDLLLLSLDYAWELRTAIHEFRDETRMLEVMGDDLQAFVDRMAGHLQAVGERLADGDDDDIDDLF